jgi:hypothetical protein
MAKGKVYGFSPWVDQVDAINQIMKETGEKTESVLLRKLLDEALEARRKKSLSVPASEESHMESGGRLETIETLLMRLVRQEDTSLRIMDVCLALLQDVLAETHATRRLSWEWLVMPELREEGVDANEVENRFIVQADQAKDYAYGVAERIKQSQGRGSEIAANDMRS